MSRYPCKLYATRTEMLGKAIWRLRIQENPSAAGTPLRELTALPQTPSWWGWAGCPLPITPTPALGLWGLASPTPTPKLVPTPLPVNILQCQRGLSCPAFMVLSWQRISPHLKHVTTLPCEIWKCCKNRSNPQWLSDPLTSCSAKAGAMLGKAIFPALPLSWQRISPNLKNTSLH